MAKESTSGDLFIDDFNISSLFTEKEDQDEVLEVDLFIDDFYLSVLFTEDEDQDEVVTISDAEYAEELQFQEALMGSMITSQMSNNPPPSSSTSNPEVPMEVATEAGKSSFSICEICVEDKESDEMFTNESCDHSFCTDCIGKHVATKIQENIQVVTCPGLDCKGVIEIDACRSVIPKEVLDRWDEAICESLILASQKFYCPFRDCSAMLVNDGVEVIRESECPICRRLFCAQCDVPWHSGVECEEYQRLNEYERGREDLMVRELARDKHWMRCPNCKFIVEKSEGCLHMTCRCQFQFCYQCGATWSNTHGSCQIP
uniref:RBR-type E3 ubiquitin transferase n=1 Tax=Davidia involucrata TaxID=16924 RepID=A0A5B7BRQ3_DAVIN